MNIPPIDCLRQQNCLFMSENIVSWSLIKVLKSLLNIKSTFLSPSFTIYSFFPTGLPASHFWNLMLTISEIQKCFKQIFFNFLFEKFTSFDSGLLGFSFKSLTDSSCSNGGILDIAEKRRETIINGFWQAYERKSKN